MRSDTRTNGLRVRMKEKHLYTNECILFTKLNDLEKVGRTEGPASGRTNAFFLAYCVIDRWSAPT